MGVRGDGLRLWYCAGGGSAIPVAVATALQEKFHTPVIEVYGMTETASVHTLSYPCLSLIHI